MKLNVAGRSPFAPKIIEVCLPPRSDWIKVSTNGVAHGAHDQVGREVIFLTCRHFLKGCFTKPIGNMFIVGVSFENDSMF